jgi:hypothetical protein
MIFDDGMMFLKVSHAGMHGALHGKVYIMLILVKRTTSKLKGSFLALIRAFFIFAQCSAA